MGIDGNACCYLPVPIAREPPFVVLGMADSPFLARVELVFNDIKEVEEQGVDRTPQEAQTNVVEHWVDVRMVTNEYADEDCLLTSFDSWIL